MRRRYCLVLLAGSPMVVIAQVAVKLGGITLLQPEHVFARRVPSAQALSEYVQALLSALRATGRPALHASGFLVAGVRADGQSRFWLELQPALSPPDARELLQSLRAVPAPALLEPGIVIFALAVGLGKEPPPMGQPPVPAAWQAEAAKAGRALQVEELAALAWGP